MSFALNEKTQMTMNDSLFTLTKREQGFLDKSWAKAFHDNIFVKIDERPFAVLYSDKASRPNTPANICMGSLIIKEIFRHSDDEMLEASMFDVRVQYALGTTSFEEQPLSDRTLGRFRERCLAYEELTGIDLIKQCITSLAGGIAKFMEITPAISRMDSMMIAANIKKLSRLELLYATAASLVKRMSQRGDAIPEGLGHYLEKEDRNRVIYRRRPDDGETLQAVLDDMALLAERCAGGYDGNSEYQLLLRVIKEQAKESDGCLALRGKGDPGLDSSALQNPSDPEATFRTKGGKSHQGYAANLTEAVGGSGSVVMDYDFETNTTSDSRFLNNKLDRDGVQEEPVTLIADGAYGGEENIARAAKMNVRLVTTNMQGKTPDVLYSGFQFTENGKRCVRCAGGQTPLTCTYNAASGQCRITLDREACNTCPHKETCRPKFHKTKASKVVSWKTASRAEQARYMESDEFKKLANIRNGVESLPSILRRKYDVDHIPVRGKIRMKLFFGCKVAALNFKKLLKHISILDSCSPALAMC